MIQQVKVGQKEFGFEEHFQVGCIGSSIPIVCDMATVHNLTEDVFQVLPWDDVVLAQIVMKNIGANCQVTIVKVVDSTPTLTTEFLSSQNQRVEIT